MYFNKMKYIFSIQSLMNFLYMFIYNTQLKLNAQRTIVYTASCLLNEVSVFWSNFGLSSHLYSDSLRRYLKNCYVIWHSITPSLIRNHSTLIMGIGRSQRNNDIWKCTTKLVPHILYIMCLIQLKGNKYWSLKQKQFKTSVFKMFLVY